MCSRRQIQEILVSIGDRQPSFIGSSDWIGAVELGYIMDEYLGITCKVGGEQVLAEEPSSLAGHRRLHTLGWVGDEWCVSNMLVHYECVCEKQPYMREVGAEVRRLEAWWDGKISPCIMQLTTMSLTQAWPLYCLEPFSAACPLCDTIMMSAGTDRQSGCRHSLTRPRPGTALCAAGHACDDWRWCAGLHTAGCGVQ